ncbi:hypothetical protein Fmac_027018 [Flemingia macrophylla]|uniref:Uncharacterized protein n=1 Tax=Flemingia macrophylla TaxID=520843 RepID=A0ABD1LGK2_9FABA
MNEYNREWEYRISQSETLRHRLRELDIHALKKRAIELPRDIPAQIKIAMDDLFFNALTSSNIDLMEDWLLKMIKHLLLVVKVSTRARACNEDDTSGVECEGVGSCSGRCDIRTTENYMYLVVIRSGQVENVPNMYPFVWTMIHPTLVHSAEFLIKWLHKSAVTPLHTTFGMGYVEYFIQNHEFNVLFNEAVVSHYDMMNLVIKNCTPIFEGGKRAVGRIVSEVLPNSVLDLLIVLIHLANTILLKLILHSLSDEELRC